MLNKFNKISVLVIFMTCMTPVSFAGVPVGDLNLLDVDFNDKVPGSFLGAGGADFGEPTDLNFLTAEVIEDTPGENYLQVDYDGALSNGRSLVWDFLDQAEITEGVVTVSFQFTPSALDRYNLIVRESGGFSKLFLMLAYTSQGFIFASDSLGTITMSDNTYTAGVSYDISMIFDMDAGTSELVINGATQFSGREHGINDRGVGRLFSGFISSSDFSPFTLDNMVVTGPGELPLVLDVDFEDKVLGDAIGTGGAAVGEPITITNGLITEVIDYGLDNQALLLENSSGNALALRWEFLDSLEVVAGIVAIEADIEFDALDAYTFFVRESGSSALSFTSLGFFAAGDITITDATGFAGIVGSYQANHRYRLRITFNMDTGQYTVLLDDVILIEDRAHGVINGRGIGRLITGFESNSSINSSFVIDDLQVGSSLYTDVIFSHGFE